MSLYRSISLESTSTSALFSMWNRVGSASTDSEPKDGSLRSAVFPEGAHSG
jgi:hypothetical protein